MLCWMAAAERGYSEVENRKRNRNAPIAARHGEYSGHDCRQSERDRARRMAWISSSGASAGTGSLPEAENAACSI